MSISSAAKNVIQEPTSWVHTWISFNDANLLLVLTDIAENVFQSY